MLGEVKTCIAFSRSPMNGFLWYYAMFGVWYTVGKSWHLKVGVSCRPDKKVEYGYSLMRGKRQSMEDYHHAEVRSPQWCRLCGCTVPCQIFCNMTYCVSHDVSACQVSVEPCCPDERQIQRQVFAAMDAYMPSGNYQCSLGQEWSNLKQMNYMHRQYEMSARVDKSGCMHPLLFSNEY